VTIGVKPMCRVALVTNIPAPYRLPVYNAIGAESGIDLHVVFCSAREPDREWDLPTLLRPHYFLKDRFLSLGGRFIHVNLDVVGCLNKIAPDVVITTGFNPTHLLAFVYATSRGLPHIPMTDGTLASEAKLGWVHRFVRRWVYRKSQSFVAAADSGLDIYRSYGYDDAHLFQSALCVDNGAFHLHDGSPKHFDLMFCGRFVAVKNPLFALQVALLVAKDLARRVSVCFVGSGPLEKDIHNAAASMPELDVTLLGFAAQKDLPRRYADARIFLLPSLWDPWGVVANEACAAGLPVIVSPHAGVAGELVRDGDSGFVIGLDPRRWADAAVRLLTDETLYSAMSLAARQIVSGTYDFRAAANGIVAAVMHSRQSPAGAAPPVNDAVKGTADSKAHR